MKHHFARGDPCGARRAQQISQPTYLVNIAPVPFSRLMFGAAFYLVTAETLQERGEVDATQGTLREAVEKAAQIVALPVTATWVKTKWGDGDQDSF